MEFRLKRDLGTNKTETLELFLLDSLLEAFEKKLLNHVDTEGIIFDYLLNTDLKKLESNLEDVQDFFLSISSETRFLLASFGLKKVSVGLESSQTSIQIFFSDTIETRFDQKHKEMIYKNLKRNMMNFKGQSLRGDNQFTLLFFHGKDLHV